MKVNLIGVPMFFGSDKKGVDYGPDKLRDKGIVNLLEKHNLEVFDCGNIIVPEALEENKFAAHSNMKYVEEIINVNTNLAHQVYCALNAGCFPFVIGGDHSLGLGSISGASKHHENMAVIWVDAHGDINTHETSFSGNVHGMPLAAAMGLGHDSLTNIYFEGSKIKPENVFLIGARDLDSGELALIDELKLNVYSTEDVHNIGIEKIMEEIHEKLKASNIDAVHLSFDIDCLDSSLVPGTGTPVTKGMNINQAKFLLQYLMESGLVKSLDFVELNTMLDKDDTTADLTVDLIDWTFRFIE